VKPANTVCRAAAGDCDEAEMCAGTSGSFSCPVDALKASSHVCRPGIGACDIEETCDGKFPDCPVDIYLPDGTVCDATTKGVCDEIDKCSGASPFCVDKFKPAGEVCRPADSDVAGSCDVEEQCSGFTFACPADAGESSIGMTFKCANDIFLAGGLDDLDLISGKNNNKYFAGDGACNIGANKKTTTFPSEVGSEALIGEGCAPALCPNNRGLSNMVWGTCELDADNKWRWACGGKLETGRESEPLCPAGISSTIDRRSDDPSDSDIDADAALAEESLLHAKAAVEQARRAQPRPA
jgi:hypothetical protein